MISQKQKVDRCRANIPKAFSAKPIKNAERHCVPGKITLLKKVRTGWVSHKKKAIFVGWSWVANRSRRTKGRRAENGAKMIKFGSKIVEIWTPIGSRSKKLEVENRRAHGGEKNQFLEGSRMAFGTLAIPDARVARG